MYRPVLVTAPASTPISTAEVKAQCRIDDSDSDTLLTSLIASAVSYLDGWSGILGRCLVSQTWRQDYDDFRWCMRLPLFPVASITSVKYLDTSAAQQTIDAANYTLRNDDRGAYVEFKSTYSFPALNVESAPISITYECGSAAADVPQAIKLGMLLLVAHWYENREASVPGAGGIMKLPFAVDALLAPFRRIQF
jgi:uncharacterized phiE125 gp8 family phage protein